MDKSVGSLPEVRKEIKPICLTIHKVWVLAVFGTTRRASRMHVVMLYSSLIYTHSKSSSEVSDNTLH